MLTLPKCVCVTNSVREKVSVCKLRSICVQTRVRGYFDHLTVECVCIMENIDFSTKFGVHFKMTKLKGISSC